MKVCDVVLNSIWYDPRVRKQIVEYQTNNVDVVAVGLKCSRYNAEKVKLLLEIRKKIMSSFGWKNSMFDLFTSVYKIKTKTTNAKIKIVFVTLYPGSALL